MPTVTYAAARPLATMLSSARDGTTLLDADVAAELVVEAPPAVVVVAVPLVVAVVAPVVVAPVVVAAVAVPVPVEDALEVADDASELELLSMLATSWPPKTPDAAEAALTDFTAAVYAASVWLPDGLTTPNMPAMQWPTCAQ